MAVEVEEVGGFGAGFARLCSVARGEVVEEDFVAGEEGVDFGKGDLAGLGSGCHAGRSIVGMWGRPGVRMSFRAGELASFDGCGGGT